MQLPEQLRHRLLWVPGLPERSALLRIGGDHHEHRESLAAHEKAVLPEFDDTASMAEVMDRSPLSDLEVGRAVAGLIERNLLQRDAG